VRLPIRLCNVATRFRAAVATAALSFACHLSTPSGFGCALAPRPVRRQLSALKAYKAAHTPTLNQFVADV
jgi:hypothetical protein